MKRTGALCALMPLVIMGLPGHGATLSLTDAGVGIDAGVMGKFTLTYPLLIRGNDAATAKIMETRVEGKSVTLKYEGGGQLVMTLDDAQTVSLQFSSLPAGTNKFRTGFLIDFGFCDGGTWQIGGADPRPFPKDKPEKPFLYQGNADRFCLRNFEGKALRITIPQYSYQQLQDNREWGWKIFQWTAWVNLDPNNPRVKFTIASDEAGAHRVIVVDRFGQDAALDFPGKVKSEEELKGDVARDAEYYGSLNPPAVDAYGGQPGSGARLGLTKTGFFHCQQAAGRWIMVDPEGNAVFHLGICSFGPGEDYTYIKGREQIYEWLPPYEGEYRSAFHPEAYWSHDAFSFYIANQIRKYGKPFDREECILRMIDRVRKFGFNSTGAFSGAAAANASSRFPFVSSLPLSEWELGASISGLRGLFDPFDPKMLTKMDQLFRDRVAPRADEALLMGYFLANEQAFEDIPRVIPTLKGTQPAKLRLVQMLQERYPTIEAFNAAWGTAAASFDALRDAGLPVTTKQAAADMQAYTELFIDQYFGEIVRTFRRYDPNHMLLGNRWQPGTANNETLCRVAGKYMDVISINYYTYAVDKSFLDRIDNWCGGKPMMLSEFYWASPSDTGLPGGKEVNSQLERGLAYRNYVEQSAALPYIIGIEWFTLIDQARTGRWFERYSGENANCGLFSVTDRPYRDCLAEMMKTNYDIYSVMFGQRPPFAFDDPRFKLLGQATRTLRIPRAEGPIVLDGRRDNWPGIPPERIPPTRLVEGARADGLEASFRACWDDTNLYLMVEITDSTPMLNNQKGDRIWIGDAVELFVGSEELDKPGTLLFSDRQVLLSAGKPDGAFQWYYAHSPRQYPCRLNVIPAGDGTGYAIEAAIPFEALGFQPAAGQRILFDLGVDDSADGNARKCQIMWNGSARNSGDRTYWGRAVLSK